MALIENLQRADLTPIEEAEGYDSLMREHGLTQEQVSERVGKSRPAVANALRLLQLPQEARDMVSAGTLSAGHARAVLAIKDAEMQIASLEKMAGMSVRQAEKFAKNCNKPPKETQKPAFEVDYMAEVENRLEQVLGRKVTITQGKTSGTVALEYYGADDLERLIAALENLTV
jgi:ParB family chromosome partitioning protein